MERLTPLLTLTFLLGIFSSAAGQTFRFTAVGDVKNPNTWEGSYIAPGQPVYLLELLETTGYQGEGPAFILRGDPLGHQPPRVVFSEFVSPQMTGHRSQLVSGDIVIFHQVTGKADVPPHILVIVGNRREVVLLQEIGSRLGNLLDLLNVSWSTGTSIPVIRTHDRVVSRPFLRPGDVLMHGDVVWLNGTGLLSAAVRLRFSQLFGEPARSDLAEPSNPTIQTISSERNTSLANRTGQLGGPTLPSPGLDTRLDGTSPTTPELPVVSTAVETMFSTDRDGPLQAVDDSLADGHRRDTLEDRAVSPLWNVVFISGLLGSIALILSGVLKTHRESQAAKKPLFEPVSGSRPQQKNTVPASSADLRSTVDYEIQSDTLTTKGPPKITTPSDSQPVMSSVPVESSVSEGNDSDLPAQQLSTSDPAGLDRIVSDQEWISASWLLTDNDKSGSAVPVDSSETFQKSEPISAGPSDELPESDPQATAPDSASDDGKSLPSETDDLEELLQNRLPVELQHADLPMRVTLFGRPAGPRRLRIDLAHTQITPPKFVTGNLFRRESCPTAVEVLNLRDQDGQETASLDRALNSLREQGH